MARDRPGLIFAGVLLTTMLTTLSGCNRTGAASSSPTTPASEAALPAASPTHTPTSRPSGGEAYARAHKLTDCMRANGVPDFPEPQGDGRFSHSQFTGIDLANLQRVYYEHCSQYPPGRR
jgi:hypothetical protein